MEGTSSSEGDVTMDKSLLPHNPLQEGRTEKGTQKESMANGSSKLFWLFGTGGNNCCPTQFPHLMDCHYAATASPLLKGPRSSQQSCLAYETWATQAKAAQNRLKKIRGTLHVCSQTTAGKNMWGKVLVYCCRICIGQNDSRCSHFLYNLGS